ncbi:protein of unknown function [Xylanibacter ruminicola]|nr:protein of unknown function [Xylanibacter ruminicola]
MVFMKTFVAVIVFGFIALAIIAIIVINVLYRNMKRMREDVEDFVFRRGRRYEAKDRNPFGEDYFKSAKSSGNRTTRTTYRDKQGNVHVETVYVNGEKVNKTTRRTTTSGGVTIVDDRVAGEKKIFEKGDDEYVEFEEVK